VGLRASRPLVATIVGLIVVVAVIVVGGLSQRSIIFDTFDRLQATSEAQRLSARILEDQLDQETGVRGYLATHGDQQFLQPYFAAVRHFNEDFRALHASVARIDPTLVPPVDDLEATNAQWIGRVAEPIVSNRIHELPPVQRNGKRLVDRFRDDITLIRSDLATRDRNNAAATRAAIDRIVYAVSVVVVLIVVAGIAYAVQQARLADEVERNRVQRDAERARAEEMRMMYTAEKRIADTLQDAIAQRPLPTLPSLRFSATYVPALEESKVGGDWYDALELPGSRVLFAIGDVAGHGLGAAVAMSRARQALVTSALLDADPATVLRRVNAELLRQKAPMVTAVAGYADASTFEFVFAVAGHPPPVLIEPGRAPRFLSCGELPLGVMASSEYRTHRIQTVPGAMLVLYTDGAVEHTHDVLEGEEIFLAAARQIAESGEREPSTAIHEAIFHGRPAGDDVAILTIGFENEPATGLRVTAESLQSSVAGTLSRSRPAPMRESLVDRLRFAPHRERRAA
jgi:serine phosphatase RsbU (regulator of sigma subunit)/CHASE3 domain sensor protein